jgi:FkbM family methyltransferase
MGHFSTRIEFCSFLDNFCGEELKCPEVEHALTTESSPLVVDIGINIGFTVRHWYCLNPSARVIGLDMMEECIAYTTEQLKRIRPKASWHPICGAVTDGAGEMELAFDDPLSGTNSITAAGGHLKRKVPANTLDHWIQDCGNQEITLLKIDVEDHGVSVLKGATQVLSRARYLALEIHSDSELEGCAQLLFHAGWIPFSKARRNTWWRKPQQAVTHSPA